MEDIRKRYNPMVDLLKFIFNKKILSKEITINFVAKLCLSQQPLCFLYANFNIFGIGLVWKISGPNMFDFCLT